MIVDEGVDLVAVKENIYYYVQVKTTSVKNGRIICSIDKLRHNQYIGKQMRYIIVARTKDTADTDKNIFFLLPLRNRRVHSSEMCQCRGKRSEYKN